MNRDILRLMVGVIVIATHALAFFGIVIWKRAYITIPLERLDVAMLLVPISATYFIAVIRSAIQHRKEITREGKDSINYVIVVLFTALLFCFGLLYFIYAYPDAVGPTIAELRRWITVLEIGFGAGFGLIAEDLFGRIETIIVDPEPESVKVEIGLTRPVSSLVDPTN